MQSRDTVEAASFSCEACGRILPKGCDVGFDGDFIENHCPSCYHDLLCVEGLIPNESEARRMQGCQELIDVFWRQKRA
jgi:hypothetical protein